MKHRHVPDWSKLDIQIDVGLGTPVSATISEAPMQFIDRLYLPTEDCVLCSISTADADRVPVSVSLVFDRIKGLGISAWAHRQCFDALEESEKPSPIPW
jgi:ethanolamine ammonia-lyase large subunit